MNFIKAAKEAVCKVYAPTPLIELLRKRLSYHASNLTDEIRIPAMGSARPDEVVRPLVEATIDEIAFAIQAAESDASAAIGRSGALKRVYEEARKRGALGNATVAEAFADLVHGGTRK